MTSELNNVLS